MTIGSPAWKPQATLAMEMSGMSASSSPSSQSPKASPMSQLMATSPATRRAYPRRGGSPRGAPPPGAAPTPGGAARRAGQALPLEPQVAVALDPAVPWRLDGEGQRRAEAGGREAVHESAPAPAQPHRELRPARPHVDAMRAELVTVRAQEEADPRARRQLAGLHRRQPEGAVPEPLSAVAEPPELG